MNNTLANGGIPPYSNKADDIYIVEITKKEAILMELKSRLKKELTPYM